MTGQEDDGQRDLNRAMEACLNNDEGRRVLFLLLEICGLYEDGFSGQDNVTNYRLGRQSIAKRIIAQMNAIDGMLYPRFLMECAQLKEREMNNE